VKEYAQKECIDNKESFSPTKNWATICSWIWKHRLVEDSSHGCEDNFSKWRFERECLHVSTRMICCEGSRTQGMKAHQVSIWCKESTSCMV
jgi:hypothetical protein